MIEESSVMFLEERYKTILERIKMHGSYRDDRTGVGCMSTFNEHLSWNMADGFFPMITGRKMFEKSFRTEFEWFINGETNTKRFREAGVKIWDSWADENGDLGPVYGHQLRNFNSQSIDQLKAVISSVRDDKDSRRHVISLWNPAQTDEMALPPCYLYFQFFVNQYNQVNMFVVQRSGDMFLGIPYDIALFSQILLYVAEQAGRLPGKIDLQIVDAHIYLNQFDAVNRYLREETYMPPMYSYKDSELKIGEYLHGPVISAPVAV